MENSMGLLGLPHFCLFLDLLATIFYQTSPLGLISFSSFFRAFTALCFCHYLLIFSCILLLPLHFFFFCLLLGFSIVELFLSKMGINIIQCETLITRVFPVVSSHVWVIAFLGFKTLCALWTSPISSPLRMCFLLHQHVIHGSLICHPWNHVSIPYAYP